MEPRDRLVFPLDVADLVEARAWIARLSGQVGVFKVGLELFTAVGPDAVRAVHDAGCACFLDLKLHDIPATMAAATSAAVRLGVRYATVHASAGKSALEAVAGTARGTGTTLLAVTVLTSLDGDELASIGLGDDPKTVASTWGKLATVAGIPGLVCSPHEVASLRRLLGSEVTLMVPGVRPVSSPNEDQKRVATPEAAIRTGADLLVVGRPIRQAPDPVAAAAAIVEQIASASGSSP